MNKIKELINELNKASELYYNGKDSFLTDREYDIKLEELKKLEQKQKIIYSNSPTINVGAPVLSELNKVQIKNKPMLSLDKVHSAQEIINFSDGYDLIASVKCDGLSVRLIYQDTNLVSANTRGNGYEGSDITEHIKHFLNVPLKIAKTGTYIIDGEAIIYNKDFEIININNKFKNNRNTASGALALLDMSIVENRKLSFIAWDIIEGADTNWYHYNLEEAEELGFTIIPAVALDCTKIEEDEINQINEDLMSEAKVYYGIPCDGIVWRINDQIEYDKRGRTEHHFCGAIAWKPSDEEYETELLDIEWSMGRTGVLTPIAIFKPVEIDGTTVERASLHNFSVMKEILGNYPEKNQHIWVIKSNMIIPQITKAIKNNTPHDHTLSCFPNLCPCCGEPTELRTSDSGVLNYYCNNPSCEGNLTNRIDHFVSKKGLDIKGLSRKTIEKLINWGWINGLVDIFRLEQYKTEWESKPGFGKASVDKILNAINAEGRHPKLESFISALGIPLVGSTIAKTLVKEFSTWQEFRDYIDTDDCFFDMFDGIGEEINNSLKDFDYTEADEIAEMLEFKQPEAQIEVAPAAAIKDKIFCITGSLKNYSNRTELKIEIESLGGKVVGAVSSKVNYLITNTPNSGSQKNKDAIRLGISIISEDDYIKMKS